jgi:glutamate racemase
MDSRPIGILDSGIGGLTIARAVNRLMPQEKILFFGDTAHLPYGEKSAHAIRTYVHDIAQFFLSRNCKMILIACNSASAAAAQSLQKEFGNIVPIVNVIDPIVQWVAAHKTFKKVGVIGTKRTVESRVYSRKITSLRSDVKVHSLATPLLVPMIEEGYFNNNISQAIINNYLSSRNLLSIDALILACTHFPLVKKEIEKYYQGKVEVIDSTDVVAKYTYHILKSLKILSNDEAPEHRFYVSDYTASFQKTTQIFFGSNIELEEMTL